MDTRIRGCVVLDAVGVFTLISAGLSLFGATWLPVDSLRLFGWLFLAGVGLLALARVCEIMRVVMRTPSVVSMRAPRPVPVEAAAIAEPAKANYPRAA
jgi:hypothetical protein